MKVFPIPFYVIVSGEIPEDAIKEMMDALRNQDAEFQGINLRDYFAAKALQGLMANPARYKYIAKLVKDGCSQRNATAKNVIKAYKIADAMLEASKKEDKDDK